MLKRRNGNSGYSIAEMAISLSVIAVLGTGVLTVMNGRNEEKRITTTRERIEKIQKALDGFIAVNQYLPCPALPMLKENDTNFGKSENLTLHSANADSPAITQSSNYDLKTLSCTANGLQLAGSVPVRTLNLDDADSYDGWNRKFTYRIATSAGRTQEFSLSSFRGDIRIIDIRGSEKTGAFRPAPFNNGALYVVISHGANGANAAWQKDSSVAPTLVPVSGNMESLNLAHAQKTYVQQNSEKGFDDMVIYGMAKDVKAARAPFGIPNSICANAKQIGGVGRLMEDGVLKNLAQGNTEQKNIAEDIFITAQVTDSLCLNRPAPDETVSGLALWLDAMDPSSDGSRPSNDGIVNDGIVNDRIFNDGIVAEWFDKSGNSNHAYQSNASMRPKYISPAPTFSGRPALYFQNKSMVIKNKTPLSEPELTLFAVVKNNSDGLVIDHFLNNRGMQLSAEAASIFILKMGQGAATQTIKARALGVSSARVDKPLIVVARIGNTIQNIDVGSNASQAEIATPYEPQKARIIRIGSENWEGYVGEVMIFPSALSDQYRDRMKNYLKNKWDIQ